MTDIKHKNVWGAGMPPREVVAEIKKCYLEGGMTPAEICIKFPKVSRYAVLTILKLRPTSHVPKSKKLNKENEKRREDGNLG